MLKEKVFLNNYEEINLGSVTGCAEVDMPGVSMKTQGQGKSQILLYLGELRKESVYMQSFLEDSKDR